MVTNTKTLRRALLVVFGLASLAVLAIVVYAKRFDLNSWKSEIEAAASKGSSMHVAIQGALELKRWVPLTVVVHGLQFQNRTRRRSGISFMRSSARVVAILRCFTGPVGWRPFPPSSCSG